MADAESNNTAECCATNNESSSPEDQTSPAAERTPEDEVPVAPIVDSPPAPTGRAIDVLVCVCVCHTPSEWERATSVPDGDLCILPGIPGCRHQRILFDKTRSWSNDARVYVEERESWPSGGDSRVSADFLRPCARVLFMVYVAAFLRRIMVYGYYGQRTQFAALLGYACKYTYSHRKV